MFHFFPIQEAECIYWQGLAGLCTKNTSWALIERPYSCAPQAVGAVYDRPGFFVQSQGSGEHRHAAGASHPMLRRYSLRQKNSFVEVTCDFRVVRGARVVRDHDDGFLGIAIQLFQNREDFIGGLSI